MSGNHLPNQNLRLESTQIEQTKGFGTLDTSMIPKDKQCSKQICGEMFCLLVVHTLLPACRGKLSAVNKKGCQCSSLNAKKFKITGA